MEEFEVETFGRGNVYIEIYCMKMWLYQSQFNCICLHEKFLIICEKIILKN